MRGSKPTDALRTLPERAFRLRARLIAVGLCAICFAGLIGRLFWLQLCTGGWYTQRALGQQLRDTVVPADRGKIYSADGALLAANSSCWTLRASPREMPEEKLALAAKGLAEILELDEAKLLEKFSDRRSNDCLLRYRVERGTAVQLIYYPEIADGSKAGATTVFPADYRIGFVLATNAWTNRLRAGDKKYRAATSDGLSVNNNGVAYQTPRTAVFRYTDKKSGINSVLFSFEDHTNDENFSDVVFTMTSNPVDAVTDIPSVDVNDGKKTANVLRGIYAFEDLWPSRGDYDMNDVMVRSDYEKVFNEKGVFEESFMLKTFANFAGNANGLAVTLTGAAADAKLEFSVRKPGAETFEAADFERDGKVVLLTPDVKETMGATYRITAKYDAPVAEAQAGTIKPFIYRTDRDGLTAGKRWEVHIPYEAPTARAEMSFFGTNDDKSIPEKGIYYVRAENYPFAFFLSGANDGDVAKLLDQTNEKSPIDQVYPAYAEWAATNGEKNKDWYKK